MPVPDELGGFIASIKACGRSRNINHARLLHCQANFKGFISNKYVANCLITLYTKCRLMASAARVFDSMISCDVVSWNALLQGYVECGEIEIALELFRAMIVRDGRSYVAALNAYTSLLTAASGEEDDGSRKNIFERGRAMHREAVKNHCYDSFVKSSLMKFYSRAGRMEEARQVFDELDEVQRDPIAWNTLLQGYVTNGESELALELLDQNNIPPDARTFLTALNACANISSSEDSKEKQASWLTRGRNLFSEALETNCCDIFVESMAIDMFGKCGSMADARRVFDGMKRRNAVSWTALMNGYILNDSSELALEIFERMLGSGECPADARVFIAALSACASLGSKEKQGSGSRSIWLEKGREIHSRCSSFRDLFLETALVNMYAQCGSMKEARGVFDKMVKRSPVSWNSLIQGYVDNGESHPAMKTLSEMDLSGTPPTSATFIAALTACRNSMLVPQGRALHTEIENRGHLKDPSVAASLIEFYTKAGFMSDAERVFDDSTGAGEGASTWNSLIGGYSQSGDHSRALEVFQRMRERGVSPDKFTFSHLLASCSHAGLTAEAQGLFDMMRHEFHIEPDLKHYTCMVDLLCRANCPEEAVRILSTMPHRPDNRVWSTILNAAGGGEERIGGLAFESLMSLDEHEASAYVSLAKLYQPGETEG